MSGNACERGLSNKITGMLPATVQKLLLLQCHRRNEEGTDVVFPVNSIAYHPLYGTFATGGGDSVVNIWDGSNKKRLFQVTVALHCTCNNLLAVACVQHSVCFLKSSRNRVSAVFVGSCWCGVLPLRVAMAFATSGLLTNFPHAHAAAHRLLATPRLSHQ
jgi:hypothetical protein